LLLPPNVAPIVLNGAVNIGVNDGALVNKVWDTNSIELKSRARLYDEAVQSGSRRCSQAKSRVANELIFEFTPKGRQAAALQIQIFKHQHSFGSGPELQRRRSQPQVSRVRPPI
jgi:hypothetical protein